MFSGTDVRVRKVLVSNEMIRFLQNFAARCSVCGSSFKFCAFPVPQGGGGGVFPVSGVRSVVIFRTGMVRLPAARMPVLRNAGGVSPPIFAVWPSAMSAGWPGKLRILSAGSAIGPVGNSSCMRFFRIFALTPKSNLTRCNE